MSSGENSLPGFQEALSSHGGESRGEVGEEREIKRREKCCKYCHIGDKGLNV